MLLRPFLGVQAVTLANNKAAFHQQCTCSSCICFVNALGFDPILQNLWQGTMAKFRALLSQALHAQASLQHYGRPEPLLCQ